jgi:outer membrane protein assembly factor BamB
MKVEEDIRMKKSVCLALCLIVLLSVSCSQQADKPAPSVPPSTAAVPAPTPVALPPLPAVPVTPPVPIETPRPTQTPTPAAEKQAVSMPRGTPDPAIEVTINNAEKAFAGTTLLIDNHDLSSPRIIEVNMLGEVVWQYRVPPELKDYTNPGFDIEPLSDGNVLFVLPRNGVYEIDRTGKTVWKYLDVKVSHDADRLSNGNTLIAYGNMDTMSDAQAKEVNRQGQVVWSWYARDHFNKPPYNSISLEGWTHTNSVTRLPNGNTLISLRNFHLIAEVDSKGSVVRTIGEGMLKHQHDPEMLASGNILMADHAEPQRAIEVESGTNRIVWEFKVPRQLVRDANRLANGNTLITGSTVIIEVTTDGEVVWRLNLKGITMAQNEAPGRGFYKAERLAYK